ncbi:hypothetical protein CBR_g53681 [Chara braunii]|uniref:Uncharacterized protein n=1 Tax=Chara braunii TaxID=69332 RepID=A0A388MBE4_CHABU|nr:hypothetical protein CBR_g53681 [Chara braunii]|eukprot:GBG91792.1 hypothetical protein CBR_g53681 [Chara braunii]
MGGGAVKFSCGRDETCERYFHIQNVVDACPASRARLRGGSSLLAACARTGDETGNVQDNKKKILMSSTTAINMFNHRVDRKRARSWPLAVGCRGIGGNFGCFGFAMGIRYAQRVVAEHCGWVASPLLAVSATRAIPVGAVMTLGSNGDETSSTHQMQSSEESDDLDCESRRPFRIPDVMRKMVTSACGMASHRRGRSAGGSAPHGEERRGTTSSPARETSRGVRGGEEERRAQNLWCDYSKRVWYLDWASQDGSDPLQPPCGPLLFVAVRADRTRRAGSIVQWVDDGEYNFKFMLKKHYRSDGSVDGIAKGCKVAGRMFGGYDRRAMSLPHFVPLAPGHDEAVHITDFLEVWAKSGTSISVVDVGPRTSISGHVGFAGGECSEGGMGGQGGLPATPPDQEVGMSDDSEDDHPRAPLKPGLHVSRRHGLLGKSTPHGGGDGERLRQGSESTTPRALVERIGSFVRGMQVAEVSPRDRAGVLAQLQTELSQKREASGNVAGEEEVSEQGLFRERSAERTQSGGKRNLPDEEEREGLGALKRQRKVGGSARTPTTREGGSVEKRKRVEGGDETPKDSSTQRRTGESSGKRSKSSRGKKADEGDNGEGDDDVEINLNAFNLDNAFFLEMQTGVQKDVVLHIHPERILAIPNREDAYNHRSFDEFLVDTIASAMIDCYERKDMRYTKPIFVLAPIVVPPENGEPVVHVLPADFDSSHPEKYWYYPVCGQHNARAAMMVKDHPVFDYYNFCKWPFRPIYFPDDEFDGYAHTHQFGNSVWEEPDVMHILFKGEDPRLLTHPVYEGAVAEDDAAALRRKQKVTPTDVEEKSFKSLTFADIGNLTQRGALYKDGERNPNKLCNHLLFFYGVADAVLFLGKPHAPVVWSLLQQGKHVLAVDGDTTQLEYTVQYVTHEVSSKAYPCDFHHIVVEPVYDPNKDMFFKLTPKKRRPVYSFLYGEQPRLRFDPQYVVRKEVAIAVLQGYHGASRADAVSFIKRLEYVFLNEDVVDPADFTLDKYKLAFGEEDDFNIETEQEESVEDDLFDLDGQLAIFNAQVFESPSVCKPGTPLATPTSRGPTPVSSSAPVKRGGLSRLRSSPGEPIRLTLQPECLRPGHPVPPDHPHLKALATPFHMGDKHTFSTAEDWGHDIVWHPDHFQPVLLDGEWAVAVRDASGGWIYDDRWDLETFESGAYDAVLERLSEVNRRSEDDPALREYGDTMFELLQSNKWLEVSSAFYALPSSPSIKQVSWELPEVTPSAGVVKRKSRGKDGDEDGEGGGQRGTGGGSEQRSTKQRSPGHAGGGEGKKGSREKKKPCSGEKTKHHRGDGQGSDINRDEDGGVLAVTGSTSMETGNDLRPGCITRPGEQDPVISSTSETQFVDAVGGAGVAKHGTCFAQLQKRLADCLGSIRTSETTSLSGTQCLPGSETTTHHGSGSDKLEPCSVSPQKEVQINPNHEGRAIEGAELSTELERVVRVSENPGDEIRIHSNQGAVSAMTDDRCQDAIMLCVEAHKELQADCPTEVMLCVEAHKELQADCPTEGELATNSNVEPNTLGAELAVVSDSSVKAVMSASLETAGARMNPNQGPVNMFLPDASLETTVIWIHPRHTDEGLQLAGVEGCRLLTTLDKDNSADDRIDLTLSNVGMELPVQSGYDDPLYSALHNEAMGEDVLKKAFDTVGDRFLYLSNDDKDTAYGDKKLRGGEVLLDIHGTLSPT